MKLGILALLSVLLLSQTAAMAASEEVGSVKFVFTDKAPVVDRADPTSLTTTSFTLQATGGRVPDLARIAELDGVTEVTVEGVAAPLSTCSDVHDCQEAVNTSCVNAGLGSGNADVSIEFNSATGKGSCTGTCSGGGQVVTTCAGKS